MESSKKFPGFTIAQFRDFNNFFAIHLPEDVWKLHCEGVRTVLASAPERLAIAQKLMEEADEMRVSLALQRSKEENEAKNGQTFYLN